MPYLEQINKSTDLTKMFKSFGLGGWNWNKNIIFHILLIYLLPFSINIKLGSKLTSSGNRDMRFKILCKLLFNRTWSAKKYYNKKTAVTENVVFSPRAIKM